MEQLQAAHPSRALREVQVRTEQPGRAAVLGFERLAVVAERHPRLAGDVLDPQVGGITALAERQDIRGYVFDLIQRGVHRYATPPAVAPGHARYPTDCRQ